MVATESCGPDVASSGFSLRVDQSGPAMGWDALSVEVISDGEGVGGG